jgi:hypothetical protein
MGMPIRTAFVVFMPQAEESRGRALAVKITLWTGAHTLQGSMQGRQMDRFRHKSCRLGGGLEALDGRRIRMGAHIGNGDRRRGLNVSCGVNAVHRPVQMDVHQHDMRVEGEGMLNGLRAATGLSNQPSSGHPGSSSFLVRASRLSPIAPMGSLAVRGLSPVARAFPSKVVNFYPATHLYGDSESGALHAQILSPTATMPPRMLARVAFDDTRLANLPEPHPPIG